MNLRKQLSSYIALNNYVEAIRENTSSIVLTDAITNGLTDLQLKGSEVKNKPETFLDSVVAKGGTKQNGTPTPDTPMDIVSNNGVLKVSPNLFDKNASYALFNGYINNVSVGENTTLMAYGGGDKTIIIKAAPNTTYTVTRVTDLGSVYDRIRCAAFTTLPSSGSTGVILCNYMNTQQANATFTTLSDTQYVAINIRNSGSVGDDWTQFVDAFQLEKGSTATQYRPYGQIYTDGTVETIESRGKNLCDSNAFQSGYVHPNDGTIRPNPRWLHTDYLYIGDAETYTYSLYTSVSRNVSRECAFYDKDKKFISGKTSFIFTRQVGEASKTFTVPEGAKYIRISVANLSESQKDTKVQLEQGSTATEYEPYYRDTATAEMLLKVGDYQDVQEILSGNVTRKIGVKVLDGTEDWGSAYSGFYSTALSNHIASAPTYCNYFQSVITGTIPPAGERENKVWLGSSWLGLGATTRFPTVAEFKQWLADQYAAGTPVIVVYPLNASTTETVSPQKLFKNPVTVTEASIDNLEVTTTEAEHTVPTPDYPLDIMCNNGVLKVGPNNSVIVEGTPETVTITGKNLLDINKTSGVGYLDTSGGLVPYNDYYCSDYIEIKPSTVYTYTETMQSAVDGNYIRFCFYDSNKTFIPPRQGDDKAYEAKTYTYKITSPVNAKYIRISSHSNFVKGQLEESIRPTKYEEYYQASFAPEDLLKLGDYQDVQSVLDGIVTRNVGIKVLDGTENWTASSNYFGSCYTYVLGETPVGQVICSHFQNTSSLSDYSRGKCYKETGAFNLWYGDNIATAIADLKQFLADQYAAGTPVIVVYPLANTVEETVESRDVFITSGTNTIERNSEYVSSDGITVKYKKLR